MGKYVNGVYVPENETDAFALGKFSNGHPQNQTAPASQTLTPEQEEDSRIGAERASRMGNPEQTSFNLFAKPQPTQPVVTPTTPVKTTPVNTTPVNQTARTQNPYNQITSMDDLAKAMGYTSPQEEDRLRKASVANRRILAVADAMRHIGNIYNTVRYAPAQQFSQPVFEEQSRYERGKAMRDKANQVYLSYQQQKAAQDAKQKQWDQQFARQRELDDWTIRKTEQQIKSQQEKDKRMEEMTAAKIAYQQGIIDDKEFNRKVKEYYMRLGLTPTGGALGGSRGRSGGGGGGSRPTQWQTTYDDFDYANRNGIPVQEETTDLFGNKTTKRRDPNVVHAEVEAHKRRNASSSSNRPVEKSAVKRQSKTRV